MQYTQQKRKYTLLYLYFLIMCCIKHLHVITNLLNIFILYITQVVWDMYEFALKQEQIWNAIDTLTLILYPHFL